MSAMLSFENAPPLSVPARFFVCAPAYGVLAGLLVLAEGPDLLLSRWTPAVLALTHLLTVGVLLQVMIGALFQLLPVAAGAGIVQPRRVAGVVHGALNLGAGLLTLGFYLSLTLLLKLAGVALAVAVGGFVAVAGFGLWRKPHTSPSIPALKLALLGLVITLGFGLYLLAAYVLGLAGRMGGLTAQHAAWGLVGWSATLIVGVAYVVVPMFQLTPAYPRRITRALVPLLFLLLLGWSVVQLIGGALGVALIGTALALALGAFAAVTLGLQAKSRRAEADTTFLYWRLAMFSTLFAAAVWAAMPWFGSVAAAGSPPLPLVFTLGVVVIFGVLASVICGMLYKILPFLCWLHLQRVGMQRGIFKTPHMGVFLAERPMRRQFFLHLATLAAWLAGIGLPVVLPLAGLLMTVSFGWLGANLLAALRAAGREERTLLGAAAAVPA
ncbi:MAG TPA: hypothetical protein VFH22_01670 [Rhodocyclaceae bacterium]|nr:hypothetical protein [Rhodocyclaceae bacterium]